MSALPPAQMRAMRETAHATDRSASIPQIAGIVSAWDDLHRKAQEVADLAALSSPTDTPPIASLLANAAPWQCELAARGIEDAEVMITLGLQALDTLVERGTPTETPALALWREYHHASEAVLRILAPHQAAA